MSDSDSDSEQKDREELPWHLSSFDHQIASPTQYFGDKQICPKPVPKKSQLELEDGNPAPNKALPQKNKPEDMQIQVPPKEINILLLGESGVGKSTFINSFANYMKHEHFEEAEKNSLSVLIPAKFTIFDKEYKRHTIEIGVNDGNECFDATSAATQDVKTYVFNITLENKPYLIRLVDTPGMGDPRGIAQDNQNCDYVLNYLSRLEKVHAICLLLNPTDRLYVFLNYCVTQILSRLEKSATQNICFLFTNTRGQSYTPGDTYTQLQLLVKKIKDTNNVTIPLSHANVFCFDNEAFRYLASIKQINVQFEEGTLESNIQSWKYSYKDIYRSKPEKTALASHFLENQHTFDFEQPKSWIKKLTT